MKRVLCWLKIHKAGKWQYIPWLASRRVPFVLSEQCEITEALLCERCGNIIGTRIKRTEGEWRKV